jgi:cyclopropane-fatty-acyl-phospholipid synthase
MRQANHLASSMSLIEDSMTSLSTSSNAGKAGDPIGVFVNSSADEAALITSEFLDSLLADLGSRNFAIRLWNGDLVGPAPSGFPAYTLVLSQPGSLRAMFLPSKSLTICEAYFRGAYDVEGDLSEFWRLVQFLFEGGRLRKRAVTEALAGLPEFRPPLEGRQRVRLPGEVHGQQRDQLAITSHFDVSNEFYALWLDSRMLYTCAYFRQPDNDLDTAQRDKLDLVCRKLRIKPGERMLDVGCGWGALAMHAAEYYGAEVLGVTLSRAQTQWAQERIIAKRLSDRCRVEHCDYRAVEGVARFDKISSVGLCEHLGEAKLPGYFSHIWKLLKPGGTFLNHAIGTHPAISPPHGSTFINAYVFPDGELSAISTMLAAAEGAGFEVRDVECLREHYEKTCLFWLHRLEANAAKAIALTDESTYRIWRLYLAYSAFGFASGLPSIYQSLLSKADRGRSGLPLTRVDWYQRDSAE